MNIKISDELKTLIPPLKEDEFKQLEQSIIEDGCRDPIVMWNDVIVDGHNRFTICDRHDISFETVQKDFADVEEAKEWMIHNQFGRRNITAFQRAELALLLEPLLKEKGKDNQRKGAEITNAGCQNSDKAIEKIDTKKELAKEAGVSHDTIYKTKKILEKAPKEDIEKLRSGNVSINEVHKKIKRIEKEEKREEKREKNRKKIEEIERPIEILDKDIKFSTIVIDPPWDWGDEGDNDQLGRAKPDYATMSIEELEELPIDKMSNKDSHIYMWITNRSLPKGFRLLEKWGFRYITAITWVKPNFGMGNYFRGQTEHILFGVKGSAPLKRKDIGTVFNAPRGKGGHSSKPIEFYEIVESCSYGPYLEMFSRSNRKDWTMWGQDS